MWPRTDFLELLGITHPIVQASMSGFTTPVLAAAVCNAAGLGSIGCATLPVSAIREQVAAIRQTTNRPFNLNFFANAPAAPARRVRGPARARPGTPAARH
jgi:nitronate monooxygenase